MDTIKIYTLPACGYCEQVKALLTEHGFAYEEINLKTDPNGKAFMKSRNYSSVPVTVIGDNEFLGLQLEQISQCLGLTV